MTQGGFLTPPPGFLQSLRKICDQHNIMLIMDEACFSSRKMFATPRATWHRIKMGLALVFVALYCAKHSVLIDDCAGHSVTKKYTMQSRRSSLYIFCDVPRRRCTGAKRRGPHRQVVGAPAPDGGRAGHPALRQGHCLRVSLCRHAPALFFHGPLSVRGFYILCCLTMGLFQYIGIQILQPSHLLFDGTVASGMSPPALQPCPVGAGLATKEDVFAKLAPGTLGGTYGGSSLGCAAAAATLEAIAADDMLTNAQQRGRQLVEVSPKLDSKLLLVTGLA